MPGGSSACVVERKGGGVTGGRQDEGKRGRGGEGMRRGNWKRLMIFFEFDPFLVQSRPSTRLHGDALPPRAFPTDRPPLHCRPRRGLRRRRRRRVEGPESAHRVAIAATAGVAARADSHGAATARLAAVAPAVYRGGRQHTCVARFASPPPLLPSTLRSPSWVGFGARRCPLL